MAAEGRFFLLEKIKHIIFVKNNQQSRKEEKDMKKITKKNTWGNDWRDASSRGTEC